MAWAVEQNGDWLPEGKKKKVEVRAKGPPRVCNQANTRNLAHSAVSTEGMILSSNKDGVRNEMLMNC